MDKAAWIDAFVLRMTELGSTSRRLGEFAERLWPHLGRLDPETVARAEHALGDMASDDFPDTEFDSM